MILDQEYAGGSLAAALSRITRFGGYSGFKVNWEKSLILPICPEYSPGLLPDVPLKIVSRFRHLGVEVHLPANTYIKNNPCPLMVRLKDNLQTWTKLPLNLLGRINIYKMIYHPRLWHAPT